MPNAYFQFKQFIVYQHFSPMKVGTDSVLLGAVANHPSPKRILDIGTGTGLLSLMMAQRFPNAMVDALEINEDACKDATNNFENAVFKNQLNLIVADFLLWENTHLYDIIISNPPYFKDSLLSDNAGRNTARHQQSLSIPVLIEKSLKMLQPDGLLWIIIPEEIAVLLSGFEVKEQIFVRSRKTSPIIRRIMCFSNKTVSTTISELVLHDEGRSYSKAVKELTKAFYLNG